MKLNYVGFAKMGNLFNPAIGKGEYTRTLPAGHYRLAYNRYDDELICTSFRPKLDEILNLGCKDFNYACGTVERFLTTKTEKTYQEHGFLLKRSFLFYGAPGTGKSVLASKISDICVENKNAIVLYPEDYLSLERSLEILDETDPGRFKVIVLEEFDSLLKGGNDWTTLLDGQFQSSNRMLVATTNHIERIPNRLLRPGRFASVIEIPTLTASERAKYLESKKVPSKLAKEIAKKTDTFTVDDLKEVVQSVVLLGDPVDFVIENIKRAKTLGQGGDED
jgi:hypothetical protein